MKNRSRGGFRNLAGALMLSGLAGVFSAGVAEAHSPQVTRNAGNGAMTLSNGASFDWHRKKQVPQAAAAQVAAPRAGNRARFGRGSYVCSPAGFGRRSHCYSR